MYKVTTAMTANITANNMLKTLERYTWLSVNVNLPYTYLEVNYISRSFVVNEMLYTICTYNVFLSTPPYVRCTSQRVRTGYLCNVLSFLSKRHNIDVFCFQELSYTPLRRSVLLHLASIGYPYSSTHSIRPADILRGKIIEGGLCIVSRLPITPIRSHVFRTSSGIERLVTKGIQAVRIDIGHQMCILFNLHLQAWSTPGSTRSRKSQLQELRKFINTVDPSSSSFCVVAGDFNVDYHTSSNSEQMLEELQMTVPNMTSRGPLYSIDPHYNQLVGIDDPSGYSNIEFPLGCEREYLDTLECPCCPQELLDYILYRDPNNIVTNTAFTVERTRLFQSHSMNLNLTTSRYVKDISDHFPVTCTFQLKSGGTITPSPIPCRYTGVVLQRDVSTIGVLVVLLYIVMKMRAYVTQST